MLGAENVDNTEIGDITIFDTGYFNQDYKLQAIWLGLLWWLIADTPLIAFQAARPGYSLSGGWILTAGAWHGWYVMEYGIGSAFYVLGILWLLAYIKRDDRIFQKIYYRAIAWIIPISWVLMVWSLIAFIIGGSQGYWIGLAYWGGSAYI